METSHKSGLTPEERARRRRFVTATDTPALFGASPFRNATDVFLHKTQGIDTFKGNDATDAGLILEGPILAWASERLGPISPGDWHVHENGINACSLDGRLDSTTIIEAKTSGIVGPGTPHQWGDEWSDDIPDYYLIQVQTQLLVTGAALAYVPALLGGRGFVMFAVKANRDLQESIREASEQFWRENVEQNVPPEGTPSWESLKAMKRVAAKSVAVADDLAERFLAAKEALKAADDAEFLAKSALIAAMGDAEIGRWSKGAFSFLEQKRAGYVVADSTFRVLRHKASKSKAKSITQESKGELTPCPSK